MSPDEQGRLEALEEVVEPAEPAPEPPPFSEGQEVLDSEGGTSYQVIRLLNLQDWQPPYRLYEANSENGRCWLWEAPSPDSIVLLRREAEFLAQAGTAMCPKVLAQFQQGERFFLVTEPLPERSLAQAMRCGELAFPDFLTILSQVAYALAQLHQKGWVYLGLRPSTILLGKPVKLVDFRWAVRIGECVPTPFYHSGYSPPELSKQEEPVDERADVFAVGALLYHFVNGQPIPETGVQLAGWECPYGGVPQILHRCLGPKEERFPNAEVLHQELLRLRRRYGPMVVYDVVGMSTIGLEPSRTSNEDALGYLEGVVYSEVTEARWLVTCVADGMGGMEAGEVASERAVRTVLSEAASTFSTSPCPSTEDQVRLVQEWVHKANEEVCAAMEQQRARGGTTFLCCLLVGKRLAIAHVGDCRLYLVRAGEITLLTRDHSLAMTLAMQEGKVDPDALRHHPDRSRLTRSLGERSPLPQYFVDTLQTTTGKPTMELEEGDILLLCSDGLWEPVADAEMVTQLQTNDLHRAAEELLRLALQRGAPDNATVVLVRVREILPPELHTLQGGEDNASEHRDEAPQELSEVSDC